jgi:methionyl-tRNA formyltransferase
MSTSLPAAGPLYLVASSRPWNAGMARRLAERTGARFESITQPGELTAQSLARLAPAAIFLPHWSHRIPAEVFEGYPCVIFHMTDLPFGRGGSPLQNLIARGHTETKVTALRCVAALDAGPVFCKRPLSLLGTAEEIFMRAAAVIEEMIEEIVVRKPEPVEQQGEVVTFRRRTPEESNLAALDDLARVHDHIRMLDATGYPKAFVTVGALRFEFSRASLRSDGLVADVRITLQPEESNGDK